MDTSRREIRPEDTWSESERKTNLCDFEKYT